MASVRRHAQDKRINTPLKVVSYRLMELFVKLLVPLAFTNFQGLCQKENSCDSFEGKCFRVAALIPARVGSKGIKNKNLSTIGNETLLSRTLRIVHESGVFDSVWVSTDGEGISREAEKHRARVHWRAPETATDEASTLSVVEDFLLKRTDYDMVAVLQCTSPFLQKGFLHNALDIMVETDTDCVFSVTRSFKLRWTDRNGSFVSPINFNPKKRPRRQDWRGELLENGMFYFVRSKLVLQNQVLQNDRCRTIEIPKQFSLEIDNEIDLLLARTLLPLLEDSNVSL